MKYEQVTQTSRSYEFGEGKEFETRDEAYKHVNTVLRKLKTDMALMNIYNLSETKIIEESEAFQIVIITQIPKIVE